MNSFSFLPKQEKGENAGKERPNKMTFGLLWIAGSH
jgi:hypothetical protein